MHPIVRIVLSFVFSSSIFLPSVLAQPGMVDSLYAEINTIKTAKQTGIRSDSTLYKTYIQLSKALAVNNPDSAILCAAYVINEINTYYSDRSGTDVSLRRIIASAYYMEGIILSNRGNYAEALLGYRKALEIRLAAGDKKDAGNTYNNIGIVYKNEGNYPEAVRHHLEALKIRESIADSDGIGASYNNLGSVYFMQNSYTEALRNYESALRIRQSIRDRKGIAVTLNNIGNIYMKQENYQKAIENYFLALNTAKEINDKKLMAECFNNIGNSYFNQNKIVPARQHFRSSIALQEEIGDNRGLVTSYKNYGWTFLIEGNHEGILGYLQKAMDIALKIHARDQEMMLYKDFADVYSRMNKFKLAFENQQRYSTLKDTILSAEKNQQIAELQTRYETEKKDKEIDLLNKDKALKTEQLKSEKTFRNAILFGSFMAFLLIIILVNRYRVLTEERKKTEQAEFEKELHELQMKALRSQMNPHFIFNCLNSVQRYILKNDKNNAVEYLQKFASLMRLILDNSEKNMVTLQDEIKMLDLYVHLEALRFDQGMDFDLHVNTELKEEDIMIPSMILQPFVENAILHGLMHKEERGAIKIEIIQQEKMLKCVIEDNGIGRVKAAEIKNKKKGRHQSKGLNITKARVDLLNQMHQSSNTIVVTDLKDNEGNAAGTRVEVVIPVE